MKTFSLGEVKKTIIKIQRELNYNDNVILKFIVDNAEYIEVIVVIKEIDYEVIRIDFKGLFDILSLHDWIVYEINHKINTLLQDYIYKR